MKEIFLHNPTFLELDDAYRSLPILNAIQVKSFNCYQVIKDLERIGFVANEILSYEPGATTHTVRAYKGKHGPCHFVGEKVKYTGIALAALDDDNHILFSNEMKDVCKKTFSVLNLPSYQGLTETMSNPVEREEGDYENEEAELDDFESSQTILYDQLKDLNEGTGQRKTLFYPGPFRMLFLSDGSILYRGKWCSVPVNQFKKLIDNERCIESSGNLKGHLSYFQEEYERVGSACLLSDFIPEIQVPPTFESDFSKLQNIGKKLKSRLLNLIESQKNYFILIGNEVEDHMGCCPSQEVTEANLLVRSGILCSLTEPLHGDSCPITLFAFKDELIQSDSSHGFSSKINAEFRGQVLKHIKKDFNVNWRIVLKWILLIFIIVSLGTAVRKCQNFQMEAEESRSLYEQLHQEPGDGYLVILFHNKKRCFQCLRMEKFTMEVLKKDEYAGFDSVSISFREVVIDDPENMGLVNEFGIFAPTLVFIKFEDRDIIDSKVIFEVTGLYREEMAFKNKFQEELNKFISIADE